MKWLHLFSSPLSVAASLTALAPLTISCSGGPSGETSPRDGGALGLDAGTFGVDGDTSTVEAGAPTDDATETADSRALDSGIDGAESDGQVVSVSGAQLTLNGVPWLSRGVVLQGFVRPLAVLQGDAGSADLLRARTSFGAQELAAIQQFDADTIRFQIGQPWLNPGSAYEPDYLNEVVDGITMARQAGFVVMIMMQDEAISGETTHHPLPTQETEDAWGLLTAAFGADRGVVFELYNEPDLLASPASWARWLDGDKTPDGGVPSALGMQDLVTYVREEGAQNVLVLDGLGLVVQDDAGPELAETLEAADRDGPRRADLPAALPRGTTTSRRARLFTDVRDQVLHSEGRSGRRRPASCRRRAGRGAWTATRRRTAASLRPNAGPGHVRP